MSNPWAFAPGLLLALLSLVPGPATAQDGTTGPQPAAATDSLARAGRREGSTAAQAVGTSGYFFSGLVGGLPLGFAGAAVLVVDNPTPDAKRYAGAGLLATGGTAVAASRLVTDVPHEIAERISSRPATYQQSFRRAYIEALQRRRRETALRGGVTGVAVGTGLFFLLLSQLPET